MTSRPLHKRGFTLIETIIAIVILAIAIPPMVWAVSRSHEQRVTPVQASTARWLAAEKLEQIIADRHAPTRGYAYVADSSYPNEPSIAGFPGFSRSVAVNETGPDLATAGTGYKRVTVTVSFADGAAKPQSYALATVLTELQ